MGDMRIGSLFSGYGGLEMGVQAVIGGTTAWHVEFDQAPSKILAHHWDVPNYGDIRNVDWSAVEPVDVLTGGFPCQDVSLAGRRAGITAGTRSGLWSEFAHAIDKLRPKLVVIENVRGLLSATADGAMEPDPWGVGDGATRPVVNAFGVVLGDLAGLGYDARWCGVRAADAGAPHGRFRVFVVAQDPNVTARGERRVTASREAEGGRSRADAGRRGGAPARDADDAGSEGRPISGERAGEWAARADDLGASTWGPYEPAIRRWEDATGRVAPAPTNPDGKGNAHRLSARFVEWMMGLPDGHVTDVGLTRNEQLKALGNGVVPQQAELAVRTLLEVF
ncbi:DNA cytosine methyltransferase [Agromyces cerinus]|nr:DNA cytosine methyltransferase [Agromyces cerinus]